MIRSLDGGTAANRIYAELRQSIILARRAAGERLGIDELARQYETSTTPVREALQRLSRDGLVESRPHLGFYVAAVTLKQLRDLFDLREILEVAAAEAAAQRITEEQLLRLERVHTGDTGDDDESQLRYIAESRRFHYLLALASGNRELAEEVAHLHDRLTRFLVLIYTGKEIEDRHRRLVDALRAHDSELARRTMQAELRETQDRVMDHVIKEFGPGWRVESGAATDDFCDP